MEEFISIKVNYKIGQINYVDREVFIMDFKLFKICIELHKEPTWEGVQAFRGIFA